MATVWLVPKQEYGDAISNIDLRWIGVKVSAEEIDEEFSSLLKMVWAFQRSLAEKLSNQDNEAKLQVDLYKNINPDSSKTIIAATHCPNHAPYIFW